MSRPYTDILRGIAIILIIVHHASLDAGERVFTPLGGIGVAIFLILSGYGITVSYMKSGLAHYWRKKVARIWLPYVLLLLTVTLLKGNASRMLSAEFVLDLLCLRTSYWFISFLVYNYILFYISHRIGALRKYKYAPFAVFAVVIFLVGRGVEAEQCFSFVTGVWIAYNMETAKKILLNPHTLAALLLTSVVFLGLKQVPQVRGAIECNNVLATSVDILIKYTFALFTISLFAPPYTTFSLSTLYHCSEEQAGRQRVHRVLLGGVVGAVSCARQPAVHHRQGQPVDHNHHIPCAYIHSVIYLQPDKRADKQVDEMRGE